MRNYFRVTIQYKNNVFTSAQPKSENEKKMKSILEEKEI